MKLAVLTFALVCAMVAAGDGDRCKSSDDCGEDECCMMRGLLGFVKGDCKKRAQNGEDCNQKEDSIKTVHGRQYVLFCPCVTGSNCEVTKVQELPFIGNVTIEQKCSAGIL